jgi:uncharacterized membrane-anchored protein
MGIERVVIAAGILLAASGCSMFPQYEAIKAVAHQGVETAVQDRKNLNDLKTEVILQLPCDASLGSVMRLEDDRKRAIVIELCGGPEADSQVSVEDLAALSRALNP